MTRFSIANFLLYFYLFFLAVLLRKLKDSGATSTCES
jgi:hypothetical protein